MKPASPTRRAGDEDPLIEISSLIQLPASSFLAESGSRRSGEPGETTLLEMMEIP